MLVLLATLFLSIAHAENTDHIWTESVKQCMNLEWDPARTPEDCQASCGADENCEIYQFYNRRKGGDCWKGEYDPDHCHGAFDADAGGLKSCDVVKAECCRYITDYDLVPHQTWGRTPRNERGEWRWNNCDEVVGGVEMTECPYDCVASAKSAKQAASVAVVEGTGNTPMIVNGFALVGIAFLLYGAGCHFFGKQESAHTEIEM